MYVCVYVRSKNSEAIFQRAKHAFPFQIKYIIQKYIYINLLGPKTLRNCYNKSSSAQ